MNFSINISDLLKAGFLLISLLLFSSAWPRTFFFSTSCGDDSRSEVQAQNPNTPWKSLAQLSSFKNLKPGDSILFKRGDTFYGTIIASAAGSSGMQIIYGSYGKGNNPVISGFTKVTSWKWYSGSVYYTTLDVPSLNIITINGVIKGMGRFPKKGYLPYTSHTNNNSIFGNAIGSLPFNAEGGEVVIRKNRWILDRHPIVFQSENKIVYGSTIYGNGNLYSPVDGNGFFIQNHLSTLTSFGDWYYDVNAKRLYMHFGDDAPARTVIKASSVIENVHINYYSYLKFSNITFEGGNLYGVFCTGTSHIDLENCIFSQQGGNAIYGIYVSNIRVNKTGIFDTINNGICIELAGDSIDIDKSTITNSGTIAGAARSGDGAQEGIYIIGKNISIRNCSVINSGYIGINFEGNNVLIEHNLIDRFCIVKDDGGGIYTYTGISAKNTDSNRRVIGNIILNGLGTCEGTNDTQSFHAHGIYMDDNSENVEIANNTVAFCRESGIFIHDSRNLKIIKNLFYDDNTSLLMDEDASNTNSLIRGNIIKGNCFFSKNDFQKCSTLWSIKNDFDQFGHFDSNYYASPTGDKFVILTSFGGDRNKINSGHDLEDWQRLYNQDLNSKITPVHIASHKINKLIGHNIFGNENFDYDLTGVSAWCPAQNCRISWTSGVGLDKGTLQVSFNPQTQVHGSAVVTLDIGAINLHTNYVLSFSLLGTKNNGNIQVYLREKNAPYNDISVRRHCNLSVGRTENEIFFPLLLSENDAFLVFEIPDNDSTVCIDNVKLNEAKMTLINPDKYLRFEYNATNDEKMINLNDMEYIDTGNDKFSGFMVLPPWSSILLININPNKSITKKGKLNAGLVRKN